MVCIRLQKLCHSAAQRIYLLYSLCHYCHLLQFTAHTMQHYIRLWQMALGLLMEGKRRRKWESVRILFEKSIAFALSFFTWEISQCFGDGFRNGACGWWGFTWQVVFCRWRHLQGAGGMLNIHIHSHLFSQPSSVPPLALYLPNLVISHVLMWKTYHFGMFLQISKKQITKLVIQQCFVGLQLQLYN